MPGVDAAISIRPISVIPIQSITMTTKGPDKVKLSPEPSPAIVYSRKLKSVVVCTLDEQGMSNV